MFSRSLLFLLLNECHKMLTFFSQCFPVCSAASFNKLFVLVFITHQSWKQFIHKYWIWWEVIHLERTTILQKTNKIYKLMYYHILSKLFTSNLTYNLINNLWIMITMDAVEKGCTIHQHIDNSQSTYCSEGINWFSSSIDDACTRRILAILYLVEN